MRRSAIAPLLLAAGALAAALAVWTRRDLTEPHVRVFPDMYDTPAYRSQSSNPVFRDGKTEQPPPEGALPRGHERTYYDPGPEGRANAARELKNPVAPSLDVLNRGRQDYERFCRHCHGARGQGDGPVAKAFPGFSYPVSGLQTRELSDGELFHIVTFGRNNMPGHASQLRPDERWKLVHYLRGLQAEEAARLGPLALLPEDPRARSVVSLEYGREVFESNCASCHGAEGRRPQAGVPTLNLPAALAVAEDDFYRDIITHGRRGTSMPAWDKALTPTQIQSLVRTIRSWSPREPDRALVSAAKGEVARGEALYRGHCGACHGKDGKGGIGNSLNNPSFLSIASDEFLRDTIALGREHTAMPAAYDFSAEQLSDLLAFLRSWSRPVHSFEDVRALLPKADAATGERLYAARCAACHGRGGEGGIGSRLASESFLRMADDRFLYRAIMEGRPGTAMPAWFHLSKEDVADLMAFLRGWRKGPPLPLAREPRAGRADFGRVLYNDACSACHGPEGRGGSGGQVGNKVFLASATDEFLFRTIAHGKDGTAMRGFLGRGSSALMPLTEPEIGHVVAYLRSLERKERVDPLVRPAVGASATRGREIWQAQAGCGTCHGPEGEGASGPSLSNPGFLRAASDGFLTATLVLGRAGTEMRSYVRAGNVHLEPGEIEDLVAYVRSFAELPPKARRVRLDASSVAEGGRLYGKFCSSCHGSDGRGPDKNRWDGYAPSLNNPQFLSAASDGLLLATIALGRPNTPMRPFGVGAGGVAELPAEDIKKIVAYIRAWEGSR